MCTDSTKPDSIAGMSVGCGFNAQCRQILPLSPSRLRERRQQQLDGCGVEADAVVEPLNAVFGVDALDRHHRHQHLDLGDLRWIAREQRLDVVRAWVPRHEVDPVARHVDAGQRVPDLVDLRDDDAVAECRGFDDGRRVFRVRSGVQVAALIGRLRRDEAHARRQVDEVAAEQFEIGVDRADLDLAASPTSCARRAPCGPENEKSSRLAMPRSNSRCARQREHRLHEVQVVNPLAGSTPSQPSARKSACFWLLPSRHTRSPGSMTASSSARHRLRPLSCRASAHPGPRRPAPGEATGREPGRPMPVARRGARSSLATLQRAGRRDFDGCGDAAAGGERRLAAARLPRSPTRSAVPRATRSDPRNAAPARRCDRASAARSGRHRRQEWPARRLRARAATSASGRARASCKRR